MPEPVICAICGKSIDVHESFIVRIDVYADPTLPQVSSEELAGLDTSDAMAQLLEEMKDLTADDLQDDVHCRFEYRLCGACQNKFLANPLGVPRQQKPGTN
jgi:hypothetical protein